MPGDPNCAFYWKGRYHLHYIYNHRSSWEEGWWEARKHDYDEDD